MSTPLVVLARHHHGGGLPPAEYDGWREDLLTRDYLAVAEDRLIEHGYRVLVVSGVVYGDGWRVAKEHGAAVFVAAHVNAGHREGQESYGLIGWRTDDDAGRVLADCVGETLKHWAGDHLESVKVRRCRLLDQAGDQHWTAGMYHVQRRVCCPSICYEPFFIDSAMSAPMLHDPLPVGSALADGIAAYLQR